MFLYSVCAYINSKNIKIETIRDLLANRDLKDQQENVVHGEKSVHREQKVNVGSQANPVHQDWKVPKEIAASQAKKEPKATPD